MTDSLDAAHALALARRSGGKYAALQVRAQVNGAWMTTGLGANALGGPDDVLVWLANHLREERLPPPPPATSSRAGYSPDLLRCACGHALTADFGEVGCVHARL